jgi:hypothetical protein
MHSRGQEPKNGNKPDAGGKFASPGRGIAEQALVSAKCDVKLCG